MIAHRSPTHLPVPLQAARLRTVSGLGLLLLCFAVPAPAAEFDTSLLEVCLKLAAEPAAPEPRSRLMQHPNTLKMKRGMGERFRISFEQIAEQADRVESFRQTLPELKARLPALAREAVEFLGPGAVPEDQRINVVCGGPSDGYGFVVDGKKELFLDVTKIAPDFMDSLMRHELWHIGFKNLYREMFEREFGSPDPLRRVAYQLVNEGVGHYYSFRRRLEPEITYTDWPERTRKVFALLDSQSAQLAGVESREAQDRRIFNSHAGVPFWEKWGAVPGAVITYRMKMLRGTPEVAAMIAAGPCEFLSRYNSAAREKPTWEIVPQRIVDAACVPDATSTGYR